MKTTAILLFLILLGGCADYHSVPLPPNEDNSTQTDTEITPPDNGEMLLKKPAIYLYPESEQKVTVSLKINGKMTRSIPEYREGWHVVASHDGRIDGRYDYLFYENTLHRVVLPDSGWIKKGSDMAAWFDEILPRLGLNAKERRQFKAYWLKELQANTLYEVKLFSSAFLSKQVKLTIVPQPDTLIRVMFAFKAIKRVHYIQEPKIATPQRVGFTVLEWGGMIER